LSGVHSHDRTTIVQNIQILSKALNLSSPAAELAVLLSGSSAVPEEEISGIEALLTVMGGRIGDWLKIGATRRSIR